MRKVIFHIDDLEYFRRMWTEDLNKGRLSPDCTPEQIENILSGLKDFKATFTLYGDGKNVSRYDLVDADGNQIGINDLNGYERGRIIGECYAYFEGYSVENPCGVIGIEESGQ